MAGAGYKLFQTGDVLTAAQVNTYLNEQTVMVFASSAARTTALTSVLAEGMVSYLQDTNAVEVYNGSAWVGVSGTGDLTEIVAGTGITVTSGTGPIPTVALTTPVAATNGGTAQSTYTTGDLLYASASNTLAKRAIGSTGNILTVAGGIPTWAAPAASSSGLTLVSATTFSSVNAHSVNSCFTSTYRYYRILCDFTEAVTANRTLNFRLRASGSDTTTNYTDVMGVMYNTNFDVATGGSTEVLLGDIGAGTVLGHLEMTIFNPNGAAPTGYSHTLSGIKNTSLEGQIGSGVQTASTAFDGFTLYLSSENMTGTIKVYGYSN
jgi:hypothetical protein